MMTLGKRSYFNRRPQDAYYTTDPRAVRALLPHLINVRSFAEPCCGAGDLIRELERHDLVCAMRGDIDFGVDAERLTSKDVAGCDAIITNPPWTRVMLHALIHHLMSLKPTWLLFDADWAYNKQASLYLPHCTHIVAVGRLKWMPDTDMTGKDNVSWYRFERSHIRGPHFYGRT